jgi:Divergent InlB B-repeat domain
MSRLGSVGIVAIGVFALVGCGGGGTAPSSDLGGLSDGGPPGGGLPDGGGGGVDAGPPPAGKQVLAVVKSGSGTVRSTIGGIECGFICSYAFDQGTSISLLAVPDAGWKFEGFGGGCHGPGACTISLMTDVTVWATFSSTAPPPLVRLSVTVTGPGNVVSTPAGIDCGTGTSCSADFTSGAAVSLAATAAKDAHFSSWGGACSGAGPCSLTLSAAAQASAAFNADPVTIGSDSVGAELAINATDLLYATWDSSDSTHLSSMIATVPKAGGPGAGMPGPHHSVVRSIRANDQFVYWTTDDGSANGTALYRLRLPMTGGTVEQLATGTRFSQIGLDDQHVYVADIGTGAGTGTLYAISTEVPSGAPTTLATNLTPAGGLAVDATSVYLAESAGDGARITRVPKAGGAAATFASCASGCTFTAVRADSQNIYWRDGHTGAVYSQAKDAAAATIIAANGGGSESGDDLDVNASGVYWNDNSLPDSGPPGIGAGIVSARKDGTGVRYLDNAATTPNQPGRWLSPRADDTHVFYLRGNAIMRVLK